MSGVHPIRDSRGNVSVLLTAVVVVAVLLAGALAHFGREVADKARAENAADAAALAAGDGLALGRVPADACAAAGVVAAANGARLLTCHCRGTAARRVADVTVVWGPARASARSRADGAGLG